MNNYIAKIKHSLPILLLGLYILEFSWLAINPTDRSVWWAENIPVLTVVIFLVLTYRKFRFSNPAYVLMAFFLMYHTVGGHFTFERTPFDFFDDLLNRLKLGFLFPAGRNNFDRVGHFLVGVFAYPIAEWLYCKKMVRNLGLAVAVGVLALGFWGALYEIIEMLYAVSVGGSSGQSFLGSQGDIWDAQKDTLLDILGAITVVVIGWKSLKSCRSSEKQEEKSLRVGV